MTSASQVRDAAAKIARDFSASVQCSAFPHSRQTADEIARMIEAMTVPDDGLAEGMAKALQAAKGWIERVAVDEDDGSDVLPEIDAVLDRFNAAKKEQAT